MKFFKLLIIIFISLTQSIKADLNENLMKQLEDGEKLIFIRHAYAPGSGDPNNFNLNDCSTQRNLSNLGRDESKKIRRFFKENKIPIDLVISSEWCRCKETALIAFNQFETKTFLNSFYSEKFSKNKKTQMKNLKNYIKNWNGDKNLVMVTHFVVITEALNYAPGSGEIVISDKNFKKLGNIEISY